MTDYDTIAHEAGHVVGFLWLGLIPTVRVDRPTAEFGGITSARREARDLSLADLVPTLCGPLAEGKPPPRWTPQRGAKGWDETVLAVLVDYLGLTETDYNAAIAVAVDLLNQPEIQQAHKLICTALERVPVITEHQLRELLGPHLDRFDIDPAPAGETE